MSVSTRKISLDNLDILHNKTIFTTNDEKYILAQEGQKIVNSPEFTILGFLNGYGYASSDGTIVKSNLEGDIISRLYIEVEHGVFYEGLHYMYFYIDNIIYKIDENLNVLWTKELDDNIKNISIDAYGSIYVIFKNSRIIKKFLNDGNLVLYLDDSDDITSTCRLYNVFVTKGCGYIYVIGSNFYNDNRVISFIDKYDVRKGIRLNREILEESDNVKKDDPYYEYHNIVVDGDYIYIYAKEYIKKINIKMRTLWKYNMAFNTISEGQNILSKLEFDDTKYENYIYFVEDLYDTNGYGFGKLDTNGRLIWKISSAENKLNMDFKLNVYKDTLFVSTIEFISAKSHYVLALDDNRVLFKTTIDGQLIELVEDSYDDMYGGQNYNGFYLLGDKIKDDVPKYYNYPLMHDTGMITIDENNEEVLLLREENKDYNNPENYEYFKLLAEDITNIRNTDTMIITRDGQSIQTMNKSSIVSREPYQGMDSYDFIVSAYDEKIDTLDDRDLVRSKGRYSSNSILLADSHKFYDNIITKKDEFIIITKKKGYEIIKKKRRIYKYLVQKLVDIDILVEYLRQNGIVDTRIPKYVDKLRHHTTHMIDDMQLAHSPMYYDIDCLRKFSYTYDGYEYPVRNNGVQLWLCHNIPYVKKRRNNPIFIENMAELVKNEDIKPFIIFINGKAIKWSDIIIIRDYFYSYIAINNVYEKDPIMECVLLPCVIRYGEDNNILPYDTTNFYFDDNGLLTDNIDDISIRVEIIDKDVSGNSYKADENKYVKVETENNQLANHHNIIVFENNKLFGDSRFYLQAYGNNIFKYLRDTNDILFKTFYFNKANDSKNMLFKLDHDQVDKDIIDDIVNDNHHDYIDNFQSQFDFSMSRNKTYEKNIAEATRYILTYDMSLLIDYYIDQNNITTVTYTGEDLLELVSRTGGYLVMPRTRTNGLDDYVVIFHNSKLYKYYKAIEYNANMFKIPIFNHVEREDIFEIIHFKNVDNRYSKITINLNEPHYISNYLRYNNFALYANSPIGRPIYDEFDVTNNIQYDVSFIYKNIFDQYERYKNTIISLDTPYYYGKQLNITSKRQFHYMYFNVNETLNSIDLNPEFRFCRNKNQYMVFIDGYKLTADMWNLNIMSNNNPDLSCINISFNDSIQIDKVIEIIYIPDAFEETIIKEYDPKLGLGDITIENIDTLDYSFNKDLFLIFAGFTGDKYQCGKVNNANIQNISMNKIRITNHNGKLYNLCICKYFEPDDLLAKIFSYGDIWSNSIDQLSKEEFEKLLTKAKKN